MQMNHSMERSTDVSASLFLSVSFVRAFALLDARAGYVEMLHRTRRSVHGAVEIVPEKLEKFISILPTPVAGQNSQLRASATSINEGPHR